MLHVQHKDIIASEPGQFVGCPCDEPGLRRYATLIAMPAHLSEGPEGGRRLWTNSTTEPSQDNSAEVFPDQLGKCLTGDKRVWSLSWARTLSFCISTSGKRPLVSVARDKSNTAIVHVYCIACLFTRWCSFIDITMIERCVQIMPWRWNGSLGSVCCFSNSHSHA